MKRKHPEKENSRLVKDIFSNWDMLEADFQREYRINLSEEITVISWRRFAVLLRNLSGDSIFRKLVLERETPIENEDKAQKALLAFGGE